MSDLTIARVWLVECQRCANEGVSFEATADEARDELAQWGWADDHCPHCNGADR